MKIIFFDELKREKLFPLTLTRPTADIRIGILKIYEKWAHYYKASVAYKTEDYLQHKFPFETAANNLFINGSILPDDSLLEQIDKLEEGEALLKGETLIAVKLNQSAAQDFNVQHTALYKPREYFREINQILYPEDVFKKNHEQIRADFDLVTKGRTSGKLSSTNTLIGDDIFVEEGAEAECASFNTKHGPIYLGKNSEVWEGSHIRGGFALCHDSQVKMGTKIYGGTTIGPYCRMGGEINNSVIFAYSSKGHEGYLGNSVVGEWCNFGADANNSNMKNNYADVKLWDYTTERFRNTGLQFCGLIMADHAKCGINTMFNTGTVVGVSANVFGAGFPRNFIPDFAWGGAHGFESYALNKVFQTAELVFARRGKVFDDVEKDILTYIYNYTEKFRRF